MDPHNTDSFCNRKASDYWKQVDLYIGGTEHAVGHLLYSRLWTKVLFDLGHIGYDEPFKKLLNQGMIQGSSRFVYRINGTNKYISKGLTQKTDFVGVLDTLHVDVNIVDGIELNTEEFKKWKNGEYANAEFILEEGKYICGVETEKMSKSKYNTVNPDELCNKYGADTFRMYEMFLGPVEASKPWDTKGIEGVHRFLRKLWRLFFEDQKGKVWKEEKATEAELKILHRTIKKIEEDTERFSFNTAVSTFMICVNELADIRCHKKEILEQVLILLVPYAPHITEELWSQLGNSGSILDASYPTCNPALLVESSKEYPVSINGKLRTNITLALDLEPTEVEKRVLQNEIVQKWLEGKAPKKIIYVKNKMVNIVV
jgi:leucyl-tRNA synthetase